MYISEVQAVMGHRHNQARTWLGTPDIDDRQAYDAINAISHNRHGRLTRVRFPSVALSTMEG